MTDHKFARALIVTEQLTKKQVSQSTAARHGKLERTTKSKHDITICYTTDDFCSTQQAVDDVGCGLSGRLCWVPIMLVSDTHRSTGKFCTNQQTRNSPRPEPVQAELVVAARLRLHFPQATMTRRKEDGACGLPVVKRIAANVYRRPLRMHPFEQRLWPAMRLSFPLHCTRVQPL